MAKFAVDAKGNIVGLGDVLDDGQAQAGRHGVVLGRLLGTKVLLEDTGQGIRADTNALVADPDANRAILELARTNGYTAGRLRILDGVG